ncbi:MAG: hypothetical protein A3F33_00550 [Candidatus Woykebacteria bacterium RIFCSPHIGHO2_12_FULL_43_10]|uniref:Glycosyl transferase family 1 n=2 Tax=Candidatus Woykeibacteriota TaxID=1817899 RepID=A0A1G1WVK3_9BACT|nr:MAG: hypothetical protein A2802_01775 [Candidatus Woykebacteria bacterium RIFCSPHIGHO2_01_FULL_43_29]OGY28347.1 MAG: hypothetical protein A3J50_00710 [Candidatus Woykebacteria bacterium RIFCSPHIGHO2_02_FULL_43_16b]OGY29481.1 MAG: hypothetical protein A3F33_00550 [Candidatus Woykebacteria bacterium RIFCSPHIGHO2_12_FULL_43_10]OGY31788.1 MAG: hypothetical protein A3A61_02195 [Candidatus Woykebacteria bacterium RIFCSPLOWO2_01_FULL_43_14]
MRIGIDARFLGPEGTGIGRYVGHLLENLEKIDQENFYVVFLRKSNWHLFNPKSNNFTKVLADAKWYTLKEQILLPWVMSKAQLDIVHVPHFNIPILYRGKMVITIHDLIKSEFSSLSSTTRNRFVYGFKHKVYEWVIKRAAQKAQHILTPTQYIKSKVEKELGIEAEKITTTYEAADQKFFVWQKKKLSEGQIKQVLYRYNIKEPFLIYVGNAYPYKNLDKLLEAMTHLNPKIQLVNPCVRSAFYDRLAGKVHRLGLEHRVILPGFVPDADLAILYRRAEAYVFPSLSEGFGLPAIEAMASGLPVVCSNIPVLKEVCGEAALYFDPYDAESIARAVNKVIEDQDLRDLLVKKGFACSKQYSWERTAKQTLSVYEESAK